GGGHVRLFPDLHAGQPVRRPAVRAGAVRHRQPRRAVLARPLRGPAALAARPAAPPRGTLFARATAGAGDRLTAGAGGARALPAREVWGAVQGVRSVNARDESCPSGAVREGDRASPYSRKLTARIMASAIWASESSEVQNGGMA